jgi:hypothetical protein
MFLFLKLLLAHMVADFILQFEELYRLKLRSWLGHFFHALIHGIVSLLLLLPYLNSPRVWIFVAAITIIHYVQDQIKYSLQAKDPKNTFWYFTIDQIVHIAFLAAVFLLPEAHESARAFGSKNIDPVYLDNRLTLFWILFIGVTFKAAYFLHSLRKTFFAGSRPDHFITSFEMSWGLIERSIIAFCFLYSSPLLVALSIFPAAVRPFSPRLRSVTDFALNYAYAALAGWVFGIWMRA